jgi:hypothetical protein
MFLVICCCTNSNFPGSWAKSPTGCCISAAMDWRFFTSGPSNSGSQLNSRCGNPYNFCQGQADNIVLYIWLLLADCSIQTNWSSSLRSLGEGTFQFNREDREDGKTKPEANSEGHSAFQKGRPKAHPVVHAMSWESLLWPACSLVFAAYLAASPNCSSHQFCLRRGWGFKVLFLRTWAIWGFKVLCLRTWVIWGMASSLPEGMQYTDT